MAQIPGQAPAGGPFPEITIAALAVIAAGASDTATMTGQVRSKTAASIKPVINPGVPSCILGTGSAN